MRKLMLLALLCQCGSSFGQVEFDWATVGDVGNEPDSDSFGRVDYEYRISKHEVTNEQYVEFLGKVASEDPHELFHPDMRITRTGSSGSFRYSVKAGFERHPVTHARFTDAMRFVNWLENGQGAGGTESGTYAVEAGETETRAPNATYFIPSENEWYKAAFYDPTLADGAGGYWRFATQSDDFPTFEPPPGGTNSVNTADTGLIGTTEVGAYRDSTSYYGTFDQTGNLWEWTEAISTGGFTGRCLRGSAWGSNWFFIRICNRPDDRFTGGVGAYIGFRVASRTPSPAESFRRGDCNDDGNVDISDPIFTLRSLFLDEEEPDCGDACDSNDDGAIDIADATMSLGALFLRQGPIPSPGVSDCGVDPTTEDGIGCELNESCR